VIHEVDINIIECAIFHRVRLCRDCRFGQGPSAIGLLHGLLERFGAVPAASSSDDVGDGGTDRSYNYPTTPALGLPPFTVAILERGLGPPYHDSTTSPHRWYEAAHNVTVLCLRIVRENKAVVAQPAMVSQQTPETPVEDSDSISFRIRSLYISHSSRRQLISTSFATGCCAVD
jgi:hypothetical protein